ncbi:MAG TPA: hypothetical protein VJ725_16675 [Thermoanaerobaculia bacterium]|nr:hypothetical protein [Thermoanaerobaculia bacterium]
MSRKSLFIAGLLLAWLAGQATQAHQSGCWIQQDRNIRVRNLGGSQASAAINDWNSMTILNFSNVTSGEEIFVSATNSGATGWGQLVSITNYSGCTILRCTAQINTYYASSTSTTARGMFCQGIGRCLGLDHSNDGGCMGGGYWYSFTNAYRPVTHNVNDIAAMYANRLPTNPNPPTAGPEVDAPRFQASWVYNPRNLGETSRIATDIVTATVTGVADGDPIEIRQKDGSVSRIPTQRVTFDVRRSRKGSLGENETFVLFQNGNDHNRFEGDPSYEMGHTYLLFLTPREDGTYLVVSPQGRYEVTRNGLVPAAKDGFSAELAGASLQDVDADLTRSLTDDQQPAGQQ